MALQGIAVLTEDIDFADRFLGYLSLGGRYKLNKDTSIEIKYQLPLESDISDGIDNVLALEFQTSL